MKEIRRQSQFAKEKKSEEKPKDTGNEEPYSLGLLKLAMNYKRQIDAYQQKATQELSSVIVTKKSKPVPFRNHSFALENSYIKMYQK